MTTDPFALFNSWYAEARASEINDSNAMALATADAQGRPSVRMVLLKGHGPDGFIFYTNYEGRKAADLFANPNAALLFHWKSLRRQVRIEGPLKELGMYTVKLQLPPEVESEVKVWVVPVASRG